MQFLRRICIALLTLQLAHISSACIVCTDGRTCQLDRMAQSSDVLVGKRLHRDQNVWLIDRVVRGSRIEVGRTICVESTTGDNDIPGRHILLWNDLGQFWTIDGPANEEYLAFAVRSIQHRSHSLLANSSLANSLRSQVEYFGFFIPYLQHSNPLIASSACMKVASAPYPVLRRIGSRIAPSQLTEWIENEPDHARFDRSRRALYITLLGICGTNREAKLINSWLASRISERSCEQLSAILTAHGELHGEPTVALIEREYIHNSNRSLDEISAAVDALRVHGDANQAISRQAVQTAFGKLLRKRTALLELVIDDLRRWQDWSVAPLVMQIYASDKQPWNNSLMLRYLRECPVSGDTPFVAALPGNQ